MQTPRVARSSGLPHAPCAPEPESSVILCDLCVTTVPWRTPTSGRRFCQLCSRFQP